MIQLAFHKLQREHTKNNENEGAEYNQLSHLLQCFHKCDLRISDLSAEFLKTSLMETKYRSVIYELQNPQRGDYSPYKVISVDDESDNLENRYPEV